MLKTFASLAWNTLTPCHSLLVHGVFQLQGSQGPCLRPKAMVLVNLFRRKTRAGIPGRGLRACNPTFPLSGGWQAQRFCKRRRRFRGTHASTRFTLSTFRSHASMHFTVYHGLLSLCMHLGKSLCTCPTHASTHFTVYSAHASMHFTVYFPCARIYASHSALALRMPLRQSLYFPLHASLRFTLYLTCACLYAFGSTLRMPLCSSLSTSPVRCIYALHSVLASRMPL